MNYINYSILSDGQASLTNAKYGWVLLGTPSYNKDYALVNEEISPALLVKNDKYYFRDCNIAAVSNISDGVDCFSIENIETDNSIKYIFDFDDLETRIFPNSCLDATTAIQNGYDISNGYMCLVQYNDKYELSTLQTKVEEFFERNYLNTVAYLKCKDTISSVYYDTYVNKIVLNYEVSFSEDLVNNYNFSGFNVGTSTISIS